MTGRCWLRRLVIAFGILAVAILLAPDGHAGNGGGWVQVRELPWRLQAARAARVETWACERSLQVVPPFRLSGSGLAAAARAAPPPNPEVLAQSPRRLRPHDAARREPSTLALHPPLRGPLGRPGRPLLRRPPNVVAERARRSGRGFYPWPNTARECGLIR